MDNKNFFQSKNFRKILYGIGAAIAVLIIFQAGMFVGYRKAGFSYGWGDNYYRTFGERKEHMRGGHMMSFFRGGDFTNSGGAVGKIAKISLPLLVVESKDGIEKAILLTDDSVIKRFRETMKPTDIKVGDFAVIIGSPNSLAQIEAKIIRIMPNPENFIGTSAKNQSQK